MYIFTIHITHRIVITLVSNAMSDSQSYHDQKRIKCQIFLEIKFFNCMDLNYGNLMREIVRQTHFKLEKRSNQGLKASVVFKGRVTQENPFNQLNF